MAWLNQRFSQFSLESSVLSFYMIYYLMFCATCWWEISSVCSLCKRDLPHTYSCTYLFNQRKTKKKTNKGSTGLSIGEPKSYYYFLFFYFIITINIFLFYVFTELLSFSINKAKVKFAKINIALIYLYSKLLP